MTDEWLQDARDGKDNAAAFIISKYGSTTIGYCKTLARDFSDVDHEFIAEIAIETAVRKIDKYDPAKGPFEAWLRTFVLHATQDWRRQHHKVLPINEELDANPPTENVSIHPSPLVEVLKDTLKILSVPDQVILHLRDLEGHSIQETAGLLKITEPACRQRHHRARERLKARMQEDPRATTALTGDPT